MKLGKEIVTGEAARILKSGGQIATQLRHSSGPIPFKQTNGVLKYWESYSRTWRKTFKRMPEKLNNFSWYELDEKDWK